MNSHRKRLVHESWQNVAAEHDRIATAFYERLFEIDPTEPLSATLSHTGGGAMTVEVRGKRRYRTS